MCEMPIKATLKESGKRPQGYYWPVYGEDEEIVGQPLEMNKTIKVAITLVAIPTIQGWLSQSIAAPPDGTLCPAIPSPFLWFRGLRSDHCRTRY